MITSNKGLDLIKRFEGLELKAYRCPAGIVTIGYGHTGADVKMGDVIIEQKATELLAKDLEIFENYVTKFLKVPVNQNQFDALVSFTYNVGAGNLKSSTLLRKLNTGDYKGASEEFKKWNKGGGKVLAGLTKRRNSEKELFLLDIPNPEPRPIEEIKKV
jgi:lysozyme